MFKKKIGGTIIQDNRDDAQCLSHQQIRFVLSKQSSHAQVSALWSGLDNTVSIRPLSNVAFSEKEKQEFEKAGLSLLKKTGIKNARFVWIPAT